MGTDAGDAVLLLGIGDAHGDFAPLFAAVRQEPTACALLQVGDLTAGKAGREARQDDDPAALASLPLPLAWVHGNHEHWEHLGLGLGDDPAGTLGSHDHREAGGTLGSHGDREAGARHVAADDHSSAPAGRPSGGRPLLGPGPPHHLWPGESYVVPGTDIRIVGLPGNYAPTWYEREKPFPGDRARHFNAADVQALERFQHPAVLLMHEA
ncbi:MAG: metallophosphoesterase, partial [Chloroflexota bacterium]|nr:metallophosphoesterase [Chloroflexota bacterium]